MLKTSDLENLSKQELNDKILILKKSLFEMRTQVATGRIEKPDKIRGTRRDIARVLTVLRKKER